MTAFHATQTGWICPKCDASNAPFVQQCACSRQQTSVGNGTGCAPSVPFTRVDAVATKPIRPPGAQEIHNGSIVRGTY